MTQAAPIQKKRRGKTSAVIAGSIGSLMLAFSMTPTFSAFTAAIENAVNTAGSGYIAMEQSDGVSTCKSTDGGGVSSNSAQCSTINHYGKNTTMVPGGSETKTITIKNTGNVAANVFTLQPGSCTQAPEGLVSGEAGDLCSKFHVKIEQGATVVYTGTAANLNSSVNLLPLLTMSELDPEASLEFKFTVTLDNGVTNGYQGLAISQPLTWSFGAGA